MFIVQMTGDDREAREEKLSFVGGLREPVFLSLCKLNFLTRARDKGWSLPQAPLAVVCCHPRHFDIDEGNLREHCWRRRLMRRVRARAPREKEKKGERERERDSQGPSRSVRTPYLLPHRSRYFLSLFLTLVLPAA